MYLFRLSRTPHWEQVTGQLNNNQTNRRRWRGGARRAGGNPSIMGPTEDLRISVPNNFHRVRSRYMFTLFMVLLSVRLLKPKCEVL